MTTDLNNQNHQLIIAALANMVTDEGLTPREAIQVLDRIKNDVYFGLVELEEIRLESEST